MNLKTEDDIPGLFRQFSGNSANYQELTRAAAARASQARWPLLSSVELERGDIPAVIEATAMQREALRAMADAPTPALAPSDIATQVPASTASPRVGPSRVMPVQVAALDADAPLPTDVDVDAPKPIVLPGNTIFMPPAANTARHFAQLERALNARRDPAPSAPAVGPAAQAEATDAAPRGEPPVLVHVLAPAVAFPDVPAIAAVAAPASAVQAQQAVAVHAPVADAVEPVAVPPPRMVDAIRTPGKTPVAPSAPTKHAGLQPFFARLAGEPQQDTTAIDSLFSRLLRS